jgi:hyaluronoglucosaminidase
MNRNFVALFLACASLMFGCRNNVASMKIYPVPREISYGTSPAVVLSGDVTETENSNLPSQGYTLVVLGDGTVKIEYKDAQGKFYARQTLNQIRQFAEESQGVLPVTIKDWPTIAKRGIVEGYYGRPWGTEGRISLLNFLGRYKMNTFIYGPKDDPYHHNKWRIAYPDNQKEDFKKLLAVANENKVNFYWAIHLGGNFGTKEPEMSKDYEALFNKLEQMYEIGIRSFAVFFDDFGDSDAVRHSQICNRVIKDFLLKKGDCANLIVCPHIYWGVGTNPYVSLLGKHLDKSADIMWTGNYVCSDITLSDVEKLTKRQGRAPYLWWNWPVNDYCRRKVLMGRTCGLEKAQYAGFVSNPMENCEANKVGIFGVADWAWNIDDFNSNDNWEDSFKCIYKDAKVSSAMRVFAEHNSDPDRKNDLFFREESLSLMGDNVNYKKEFKKIYESMLVLEENLPTSNKALWFEIEGWVKTLKALSEIALEALKGEKADIRKIAQYRKDYLTAQSEHVERFASATFQNDKRYVKKPEPGSKILVHIVDDLVVKAFKKRWEAKMGREFKKASGFEAISNIQNYTPPTVTRDMKYASLGPLLEPIVLQKGEYIGLKVPSDWKTNYARTILSSTKGLCLEFSADGKLWKSEGRLSSKQTNGVRLDQKKNYRYMRLRNLFQEPAKFKITVVEFYVDGEYSTVDLFVSDLI